MRLYLALFLSTWVAAIAYHLSLYDTLGTSVLYGAVEAIMLVGVVYMIVGVVRYWRTS